MYKIESLKDYLFPNGLIQIFAKAPIVGQVKTRLKGVLSEADILIIYKQMLNDVITMALGARVCPVEIRVALDPEHEFFLPYIENHPVSVKAQNEGDLGQRMEAAFNEALAEKDFVIAIGGDCVSINASYLLEAAQLLAADQDVVLGPAEDGGYILLGMQQLYPEVFQGIPWGQANVLALSVEKLERSHVNYSLLGVGWDVDTLEDLRRYQATLSGVGAV